MKLKDLYSKFEKSRVVSLSKGEKASWLKLPKKKKESIAIRIVPYSQEGDVGEIRYVHYGIGGKKYDCLNNVKRKCPICDVLEKHDYDNVKRYLKTGCFYTNVQLPTEPDKIYALNISEYFVKWCNDICSATGITDLFDPITGRDIIMWRKSDKGAFERQISPVVRAIANTPDKVQELIKKTINFSKYFKPLTDEYIGEVQEAAGRLDKELYNLEHTEGDDTEEDLPDFTPTAPPVVPASTTPPVKADPNEPTCYGQFKGVDNLECISCAYLSECMNKSDA